MRILWFSNRPPARVQNANKGVGGSWIESLENELLKVSGIDLGFVYSDLSNEAKQFQIEGCDTTYFMVPRDPFSKTDRWIHRFFSTPLSTKPLKGYLNAIDDFKPDVVLFFGTESDFSLIVPRLQVPSVIWFQGNLTVYDRMFENGISIKMTRQFESLKSFVLGDTFRHNYRNFKHKVDREQQIFEGAQNFIGRTNWDRRIVSVLAPQAQYHHCDEILRPTFWQQRWKQGNKRDKFIIMTTIRGNLYKGLETVYEACYRVSKLVNVPVEWRIAGIADGSVYVKSARKQSKVPDAFGGVKLLGSKNEKELVDELLNADLYVHPSHIENSPNGVQEAMLLGMPVIATNVGGTSSLLVDDFEGILLQNKDPFALAGAILELYNAPEKAKIMGENAYNRAIVRNDGAKICSDLLAIFEQISTDFDSIKS